MKKVFRIPYAPPEESSEDESLDESSVEGKAKSSESHEYHHGISQEKKAQWLSSVWKLEPFNEKLPPSERKAEWRKFRDQFERISDCKIPVDPVTKLKGIKIYAGEYLLNIIGMQEKAIVGPVDDIYAETIRLVDNYFESTCNRTQERMKFRRMKQKADESFTDWVLRLESQSKFCDLSDERRKEEFLQAIIGSSVPELAEKLYEASNFFKNDISQTCASKNHPKSQRWNLSKRIPDPLCGWEVKSLPEAATRIASSRTTHQEVVRTITSNHVMGSRLRSATNVDGDMLQTGVHLSVADAISVETSGIGQ